MLDTSTKTIIILYTELAGYLLSCINELSINNVDVHVVNYPVNKEAPFQFKNTNTNVTFYNRSDYDYESLIKLVEKIKPSLIYCAGWSDKDYLKTVKYFKSKITTLLGFDNQWEGSLKQQLSSIYARLFITPYFKYAFVPGNIQQDFALKLGFKKTHIITGAYSANTTIFEQNYLHNKEKKRQVFPHKFIFVGRYIANKGLLELWQAFTELQKEQPNDWELWCLGVGDIPAINNPKIKHFGFVQPSDLAIYTEQTSVFVLPSRFEPWGVVVHEYAASGFPLLLSNRVGAKEKFLQEGKNGFEFEAENVKSIKRALQKIVALKDSELFAMGAKSNELSKSISPKTWADSLLKIV